MKRIWCSKTFWFNAIVFAVGGATYLTGELNPQLLLSLGISAATTTLILKTLGGVVTVGNIFLRYKTNTGIAPPVKKTPNELL